MPRTILMTAIAACGGFCLAGAAAYGYAKLNAWQAYGERFQLGYVVGYLDAAQLSKVQDPRVFVPSDGRVQYERWRDMVNEFFANPSNAAQPIADGMKYAGDKLQAERLKALDERLDRLMRQGPPPSPASVRDLR